MRMFVGWCRRGTSDKVWACIRVNGNVWAGTYATIWARRGRRLQHKIIKNADWRDMDRLIESKILQGYQEIDDDQLDQVYPEFDNDLKKTEVWARLST